MVRSNFSFDSIVLFKYHPALPASLLNREHPYVRGLRVALHIPMFTKRLISTCEISGAFYHFIILISSALRTSLQ